MPPSTSVHRTTVVPVLTPLGQAWVALSEFVTLRRDLSQRDRDWLDSELHSLINEDGSEDNGAA